MYSDDWCNRQIKEWLEKYKLEVNEEDFSRLVKLLHNGEDSQWIIRNMAKFNKNLTDVLVSYIYVIDGGIRLNEIL